MLIRLITTRPFWSSLTQNDECFFIHRKELLFIVSIVQPSVLGIRQDSRRWFFAWSRSGHGWSVLTPTDIEVNANFVELFGVRYIVTTDTGETHYGANGACAFAYYAEDIEDLKEEIKSYTEFCDLTTPVGHDDPFLYELGSDSCT